MKNLDAQKKTALEKQAELRVKLKDAFDGGDNEEMALAMGEFGSFIQENILSEARSLTGEMFNDHSVLTARGVHQLTSEEKKYYNAVISGGSFSGVEELVPETVINRVFEDLIQGHPLLAHIDFVPVGATTKWIFKNGTIKTAWWGKLCSDIKEVLDEGFDTIDLSLFKLSGFMPVCNAMLDLGPEWLDRYVREVLAESINIGLEDAIVGGTGVEMPTGMMMDMTNFNASTGYDVKTAIPLPDLTPKTLGQLIMAPLTKNGTKIITESGANGILFIVNPLDYWEKIFPATTPYIDAQGVYKYLVSPLPVTYVQSTAMPRNRLVAGKGADYFMGVGSSRKFEVLKELRAIEDETVYLTKMYGNGKPKDNDSFLVFDIEDIKTDFQ